MSPMQHELYARTVLDDHRREAVRFRATRRTDRARRARLGVAVVGTGERLRRAGRRWQPVRDTPVVAPCVDC